MNKSEHQSFSSTLRDVGTSAKDLVQSEIELLKVETKDTTQKLMRHTSQIAVFGALFGLSVFPFLAFLVIGLGRALDGRYWLSSLIVSAVCAVIGGPMAYRAYKKIKDVDLTLPATRETVRDSKESISHINRRSA